MKMIDRTIVLLTCTATLWTCGCGGGAGLPSGGKGTVTGKVTYNGQPVPQGCIVSFIGPNGITGSGITDGSGSYRISMRDGRNVLVGGYRISVSPPPPPPLSDDEAMKLSMAGKPTVQVVKEVPERYRNPENSPLAFEVMEGANTFDIALTD